jgi:hypothetical protein
MNNFARTLFCLGFALAWTSMTWAQALDSARTPSLDRIRIEYSAALKQIEDYYAHIKGRGRKISDLYGGVHTDSTLEFSENGDWRDVAMTARATRGDKTTYAESVWAKNSQYQFQLLRVSHQDAYAVRDYGTPSGDVFSAYGRYNKICGMFVTASHNIMEVPVSLLLSDPSFVLTEASEIQYKGRKMIKLGFRCDGRLKVFPSLYSGSVVISPADHYSIYQWEAFRSKKMVPSRSEIEYSEPHEGIPVPRRVFLEHTGDSAAARHVVEFDEISPALPPESDFRLAAFGLPEIGSQTGRRGGGVSIGFLMFGVASIALLIALMLRHLGDKAERGRFAAKL